MEVDWRSLQLHPGGKSRISELLPERLQAGAQSRRLHTACFKDPAVLHVLSMDDNISSYLKATFREIFYSVFLLVCEDSLER